MRKGLVFIVFILGFYAFSQDLERVLVYGKIAVEKSDVEGIVVRNISSNVFVFTNELGEFNVKVKQDDLIEVSALQYQNITFKVNDAIIKSGIMKIYLIEEINQLEEVFVSSNKLSGNLNKDINKVSNFQNKKDVFYFGINKTLNAEMGNAEKLNDVALNVNHNVAMNPERLNMINGLNVVNVVDQLLLPLFRSGVSAKNKLTVTDVPSESIKYYFGSKFLVDNFNIPEHRVDEFIGYVYSSGFDYALLNYGNEMLLLELLYKKSVDFLNSKK